MSADLIVGLETPLPAALEVARATAVFCYGTCFHRHREVADLALLVDGVRHRVAAARMPRADVAGGSRSGFWATVPIAPRDRPGAIEVALAARLADGQEEVAALGRIEVVARATPPALGAPAPEGLIAVCMATFEPDFELFRTQVESLRAQTDRRWVCVVSDDCSSDEHARAIAEVLGDDPRFVLSRSDERLGFYRNFERALTLAPAEARLLALCDQDDRWYPEKLATLRGELGGAQLVYSDQRLVDADGNVLRDTLWQGRRNNHTDLTSMLVANSITGAAALFRREVVELALPFPDTPGLPFHDAWLAVVALASGDVAYVDRPLYDYVQHRGAFFGAVTHGDAEDRSGRLRGLLRGGRAAYFRGYLPRAVLANVLLARCGERLSRGKRRALERYVAAERSLPALAWLAARSLRVLWGRNETLGSEAELLPGLVWRRVAPLLGRDAGLPDMLAFQQKRLRRWRADV